jgi:hypothetical protein
MSTVTGGQGNIVTNGLVLNLDAANPRSYPQPYNGTVWADLSGNGNNGTLVNGPLYNAANGGNIVFDGINDYVNLGQPSLLTFNNTSSYSLSFWINKKPPFKNYDELISNGYIATQRLHFLIDSAGRLYRWDSFFTTGIILNVWTNIVYTFSSSGSNIGTETFFINGNQTETRTGTMPGWNIGNIWIGYHSYVGGSWPFNGNIAQTSIYNRALSPQEVLQNYNATRARFGV